MIVNRPPLLTLAKIAGRPAKSRIWTNAPRDDRDLFTHRAAVRRPLDHDEAPRLTEDGFNVSDGEAADTAAANTTARAMTVTIVRLMRLLCEGLRLRRRLRMASERVWCSAAFANGCWMAVRTCAISLRPSGLVATLGRSVCALPRYGPDQRHGERPFARSGWLQA